MMVFSGSRGVQLLPLLCIAAFAACNEERAPIGTELPDAVVLDDSGDVSTDVDLDAVLPDAADPDAAPDTDPDADPDTAPDADPDADADLDAAPDADPDADPDAGDPSCGNGVVEADEECDDANDVDNDQCSNACRLVPATQLCAPCTTDADCGRTVDRCLELDGGAFCGAACADGECPAGFACSDEGQCVPDAGTCLPCLDLDNDGFGIGAECAGLDCDDTDALVYPGASELCDNINNDCDDATADGADDDGVGVACDGADDDLCLGGLTTCRGGDVVCEDPGVTGPELCDGADNDCNPATPDGADEPTLGSSCDGPDADRCSNGRLICSAGGLVCDGDTPTGGEVCNGLDDDCDGTIDEDASDALTWYRDADGDGWGDADLALRACAAPMGYVARAGDCDDSNDDVNPGAAEVCDGVDNNCDDAIDNGATDAVRYWVDADRDGFGANGDGTLACAQPPGTSTVSGDCNDDDAAVNPDAAEVCGDSLDNNCDTRADCDDAACADTDACADTSCASADLGSALGRVAAGNNFTAPSNRRGSCGGTGGEVIFTWTAPAAGRFRFDTGGSTYDTVLYLLRNSCTGAEAACNDDITGSTLSRVFVDARAGERFVVVLDSAGFTSRGNYALNIAATEICDDGRDNDGDTGVDCFDPDCSQTAACLAGCPTRDIGSVIGNAAATGTTVGSEFRVTGSCGGDGRDSTLRWTAPRSATYTFAVAGSGFAPVLHLRNGSCTGAELACASAVSGGSDSPRATITRQINAGQTLTIAIDGNGAAAGAWSLAIVPTETGYCTDRVDNDADSAIDCADLDCDLDAACCPADRWEPNEGNAAGPSTLYSAYLTDPDATLTLRPGDVDSFNVPVCTGAELDVRARFVNSGGNIDLRVRNQSGTVVAQSVSTTSDGERIRYTVNTLPPGNRLFVQAYMPTGVTTCNDYVLEIEVDGCD